jgi:formylmethanofuran dehydrogenase subunit E
MSEKPVEFLHFCRNNSFQEILKKYEAPLIKCDKCGEMYKEEDLIGVCLPVKPPIYGKRCMKCL